MTVAPPTTVSGHIHKTLCKDEAFQWHTWILQWLTGGIPFPRRRRIFPFPATVFRRSGSDPCSGPVKFFNRWAPTRDGPSFSGAGNGGRRPWPPERILGGISPATRSAVTNFLSCLVSALNQLHRPNTIVPCAMHHRSLSSFTGKWTIFLQFGLRCIDPFARFFYLVGDWSICGHGFAQAANFCWGGVFGFVNGQCQCPLLNLAFFILKSVKVCVLVWLLWFWFGKGCRVPFGGFQEQFLHSLLCTTAFWRFNERFWWIMEFC